MREKKITGSSILVIILALFFWTMFSLVAEESKEAKLFEDQVKSLTRTIKCSVPLQESGYRITGVTSVKARGLDDPVIVLMVEKKLERFYFGTLEDGRPFTMDQGSSEIKLSY